MISLCSLCKKRNRSALPECPDEKCHICRGASARLDGMAADAAARIPKEWKTFAISTEIPREMMAQEEDAWDSGLGESLKNEYNRRIVAALVKKTGLDYDFIRADGKITFDFSKNEVRLANADIFIFGRYRKFRTDVSQSEWTCRACNGKGCEKCDFLGVKYNSVEVIIGKAAKEIYGAKDAELHSSGREDVDALNLAGRPFVMELRSPSFVKKDLSELSGRINGSTEKEGVSVSDLKYVSNAEVALISDSHFDKAYEAEVEVEGGLAPGDLEKMLSLNGMMLNQRTPERVAHRRSDLVRKRRILDLRVVSENPLRLYVFAEAGTYIKEFIGGDDGRTLPSVAEIIGKKAKCIKLSVVEIDDGFLADIVEGK